VKRAVSRTTSGSTANEGQRFGKELRVRSSRHFAAIQKHGRKRHSANFVILSVHQSPPGNSRFGFAVSRRVGNAVIRNRLKRRLREMFRLHRRELAPSRDFVVIAKPSAAKLSYADVVQELRGPLSN
jgi:ribonuclease P protein component